MTLSITLSEQETRVLARLAAQFGYGDDLAACGAHLLALELNRRLVAEISARYQEGV